MNETASTEVDLTLEQAASLLSGADMDTTRALSAQAVPPVKMTDGSNGVAMNLPSFAGKVAATCYPTLSAMAATWDPDLVTRVAEAIAIDARKAGAQVLLAPGMNIKRSPLGGRNFEYFSEDPHLTGRLATAFVRGVQRAGVGACVKHFAANNQETDRMRVSADVGARALREIYLRAFEEVVTEAKPWLVMASYNRINGTYATQNGWLLTDVLRDEWGFEGVVVSDWGAVDDRVAALAAGLDLEMPSTSGASDALVVAAVAEGRLDESTVRASAQRIVDLARKAAAAAGAPSTQGRRAQPITMPPRSRWRQQNAPPSCSAMSTVSSHCGRTRQSRSWAASPSPPGSRAAAAPESTPRRRLHRSSMHSPRHIAVSSPTPPGTATMGPRWMPAHSPERRPPSRPPTSASSSSACRNPPRARATTAERSRFPTPNAAYSTNW